MVALNGLYKGKVSSVSLGGIGKNDTPAIEVGFKVSAELVGSDWKDMSAFCKKDYWLSDKVIDKGKAAGKTSIEITRDQIKETYNYEGPLEEEALKAGLIGKDVELSCKPQADNDKYTEVGYVNPPGGRKGGLKKLKAVSEDKLASLAALWSGKPKEEKQMDASELFKTMTQGAA